MSEDNLTRTFALYRHNKYGWLSVFETGQGSDLYADYARATEEIEVVFVPLPKEDVIANALRQIDLDEKAARLKFQKTLDDFKDQRAKLLSLPSPERETVPDDGIPF